MKSELNETARKWLAILGDFGETVPAQNREIKGYMRENDDGSGGRTYWNADEVRELGRSMLDVAEWLDLRASEAAKGTI